MSKTTSIQLATGTLHLTLQPGKLPIHRLLGFAARISSKRKFLLVSKVLAKHYPVTVKMLAWSYRALARKTLAKLDESASLWIGMAETATGLGYGVYSSAVAEGMSKALFLQTTRYLLSGQQRLAFTEEHSHATDFFLYYPEQKQLRQQFLTAKSLVLIDDEISTGKTFLRLIKAYQAINPYLEKVLIASLVNFAQARDRRALEAQAGLPVAWVFFRDGVLSFDDAENTAIDQISVNVSGNGACKNHLLAWPGRLGIAQPIELAPDTANLAITQFSSNDNRPVLVLGTGECNAPAYLLARQLTAQGVPVFVQSTTRSPIHVGNDIQSVQQFTDNYEDGIANFIYNLNPDRYREIIICHETPLCSALTTLLLHWQAISARFEYLPDSGYAKLHFFRP